MLKFINVVRNNERITSTSILPKNESTSIKNLVSFGCTITSTATIDIPQSRVIEYIPLESILLTSMKLGSLISILIYEFRKSIWCKTN